MHFHHKVCSNSHIFVCAHPSLWEHINGKSTTSWSWSLFKAEVISRPKNVCYSWLNECNHLSIHCSKLAQATHNLQGSMHANVCGHIAQTSADRDRWGANLQGSMHANVCGHIAQTSDDRDRWDATPTARSSVKSMYSLQVVFRFWKFFKMYIFTVKIRNLIACCEITS